MLLYILVEGVSVGNRMDKYNDSNVDNIPKRSDRNKELYRQIYNAYDEFENLVVPSNAKEIDLSTLKREISSRDEYKKIKDYGDITNNKVIRKEIIQEEQKKENEIYDINELIKNAVKDNNIDSVISLDEKEDYLKKLRLDDVDLEKEVSEDIEIDEELIKTANLSLDILSDLKGDNEDTMISAVEKDNDDDSQFYSDQYQFDKSDFDNQDEISNENSSDGKIFWKIFLLVFCILLIVFVVFLLI